MADLEGYIGYSGIKLESNFAARVISVEMSAKKQGRNPRHGVLPIISKALTTTSDEDNQDILRGRGALAAPADSS
jgi:hypothetical protein